MATASSSSRARTRANKSGLVLQSLSPSEKFYTSSNGRISSSASGFIYLTSSSFSSPTSALFHHHYHHHQDHHYYNQQIDHHYYNRQINHHYHHIFASPTRVNLYTSSSPSPYIRFFINHRLISPNHHWNRFIAISKKTGPISMPKKTCMCSLTSYSGSFCCNLHKNQGGSENTGSFPSNKLNMNRSTMTNSLRRRAGFQPRPSRLSAMSTADY
ncbi:hypothetical protein ACFX15_012613 [Malus domestica]